MLAAACLAASVALASLPGTGAAAEAFPGSSALEFGYDLLSGNPIAAAADPGWRTQGVFDVNCPSCFAGGSTFGSWSVPDGVTVLPLQDCEYNSSTVTLRGGVDFQSASSTSMRRGKGFDIILADLEFAVAKYTKKLERITLGGAAVVTLALGKCNAYRVSLDAAQFGFPLTANFKAALASLPDAVNASTAPAFLKFVQTFGTHLPESVDLGAMASQESVFTGANFSLVQSTAGSVSLSASASLLIFFGGDVSAGASWSLQDYLTFAVSSSSNTTRCKPSCPPSSPTVGVDPTQWADTLGFDAGRTQPVPVASSLVPLPQVLLASAHPSALLRGEISRPQADRLAAAAAALLEYINGSLCAATPGCAVPPSNLAEDGFPAALPVPAVAPAAAMASDSVLVVIGGASDGTTAATLSDDVSVIDVTRPFNGWIGKGKCPSPVARAAVAAVPSNGTTVLIISGGLEQDNAALPGIVRTRPTNATWVLDPATGRWAPGQALPSPRHSPASALFAGVLVLVGGENASHMPVADVVCVGPDGFLVDPCPAALAALPVPVSGAGAASLPDPYVPGNEMLVVAGGCSFGSVLALLCEQASSAVWTASTAGPGWQSLAAMPQGRYSHSVLVQSAVLGRPALVVVGGSVDGRAPVPASSVLRASLSDGAWATLPWPDPWPAAAAALVRVGNTYLRLGGVNTTAAGLPSPAQRVVLFSGGV